MWCLRSFIALFAGFVFASASWAQGNYFIRLMGLTDAEHRDANGFFESQIRDYNANWVVGDSFRNTGTGNSLWYHHLTNNTTVNITLADLEHTSSANHRQSVIAMLDAQGHASIQAERYNGGPDYLGHSTWDYHIPTNTYTRMGFTGSEYTSSTGEQFSTFTTLTPTGQVIGWSNRFLGAAEGGTDPWLFNRTTQTTTRYGLIDAAHTASTGYRYSMIHDVNASNVVVGTSERYDGQLQTQGSTAWRYQAGVYTTLGLTDAEHTANNGVSANSPNSISSSGIIVGYASRFNGGNPLDPQGTSTWIYQPSNNITTRIGLISSEYISPTGQQTSYGSHFNDDIVLGTSFRYAGTSSYTYAPWLYRTSTNTTTRLGLIDAEHTGADQFQNSNIGRTSNTYLVGGSARFAANGTNIGASAWVYQIATSTTQRIGLIDAEHTALDGTQSNSPEYVNNNGVVLGYAHRYAPGTNDFHGFSTWVYQSSTNTTTKIPLDDPAYTRNDGFRLSQPQFLNEAGLLTGYALRYLGTANDLGYNSFLYDTNTSTRYILEFSVRPNDQYSRTDITQLTPEGLVYGYYSLFDSSNNDLGYRAFTWSIANGFSDVGAWVAGGLTANNWNSLEIIDAIDHGQYYGRGIYNPDVAGAAFVLVAVPEARHYFLATVLLITACTFSWQRYRRKHLLNLEVLHS